MDRRVIDEDLETILSYSIPWEEFDGSRVLVTGAAGMLPAYMVETLLALNERKGSRCDVVGLVRNLDAARERFGLSRGSDRLSLQRIDLRSPVDIDGPADFIIHAASQASPRYYGKDPVGTIIPNAMGTKGLLDLARIKGTKRFLFFSSGEVYGRATKIPTDEDSHGPVDPMDVRSCYAESKRMGENLCACYFAQFEVETIVVRPFHTYGPGMKLDDGRVFADFVSAAVDGRDIEMRSDGSATRAFCYIADATAGFFTAMLKGKPGAAYNVGSERETSVKELAREITRIGAGSGMKVVFAPPLGGYMTSPLQRNVPDCGRIAALGWTARTSLSDGFSRTIAYYRG